MKKYILTLILALASLGLYAQTNRNKTIIKCSIAWLGVRNQSGSQPRRYRPTAFPRRNTQHRRI
mgnify:CR=1 FL=1